MQKTIFLSIFTFMITYSANCQITKNNWLVGGNLSYSNSKSIGMDAVNSKTSSLDIMTNVGYFIHDKIAIGLKLNNQLAKLKIPQVNGANNTIIQNNFGIGPFIRYYFLDRDNRVNVFSDGSGYYTLVTSKRTGDIKNKYMSIDYSIFLGSVIFLNSSVGLEFLLGYNNSKAVDIDSRGEKFQLRIGLQIHLEKE